MYYSLALFLAIICIVAAQGDAGCSCKGVACNCCAEYENGPLTLSTCADLTWDAANKSVGAEITFGGAEVLQTSFSQSHPSECINVGLFKLCFTMENATLTNTGACACFSVAFTTFGVNVALPLGFMNVPDDTFVCPTTSQAQCKVGENKKR
mmetsp:Transcript_29477/g.32796  ORF Transcript_29477/g.32796 Transcript_29477/m.32796 type:complete len:152 (+) Transcript_29477:74-529(+)